MVAVIFLDIDGVICCNMAGRLEEQKLANLNDIVKATQAKVVLSTDWRRQANLKRQGIATLKRLGIEVIGATPMKPMFSPVRPVEINEWMHANAAKEGVTSWVAIDDRDLVHEHGGGELKGHFVHTHPASGLTKRLAEAAISILGAGGGAAAGAPAPPSPMDAYGTSPARAGGFGAALRSGTASSSPARSAMGGALGAPSTLAAVRSQQQTPGAYASPLRRPGAPPGTPGTRRGTGLGPATPSAKLRASTAKSWSDAPRLAM